MYIAVAIFKLKEDSTILHNPTNIHTMRPTSQVTSYIYSIESAGGDSNIHWNTSASIHNMAKPCKLHMKYI